MSTRAEGDRWWDEKNASLMLATLDVAVYLWVLQMQLQPWSVIEPRLGLLAERIASTADNAMFYTKGKTGEAFNAIAEGIAALSFAPGGVRFGDRTWAHRHPDVSYPE